MEFKLHGIKLRISYSFIALLVLLLLILDRTDLYILVFSALHEAGHILCLLLLGGKISGASFNIYGIHIVKRNFAFSPIKEIFVSVSGPAVNLILAVFFALFGGKNRSECISVNLMIFLFNMLPFYTFDGGIILRNLLTMRCSLKTTETVCMIFSVVTVFAVVFGFGCLFAAGRPSFFMLIAAIYMTVVFVLTTFDL